MSFNFPYLQSPPDPDFSEQDEENSIRESLTAEASSFSDSEVPTSYEPQKLNATHREIIRLKALGYNHTKVAKILGVTPAMVGYTVNSPLGQSMLSEIEDCRDASVEDVRNRLQELSPLATEIFADQMNDDSDKTLRLRAAEKVLEMTGHKAANVNLNLSRQLTSDDIEDIKRKAKAKKDIISEAEEAEYDEVKETGS